LFVAVHPLPGNLARGCNRDAVQIVRRIGHFGRQRMQRDR
jgi:hypothetical protein